MNPTDPNPPAASQGFTRPPAVEPTRLDDSPPSGAFEAAAAPEAWPDLRPALGNPLVLLLFRWIVGGLLLFAAYQKIHSPKAFALSIGAFGMVPRGLIAPLAFFFIWQEITSGVLLVLGIWSRGAALVAAGLLTVFLGALGFALITGLPISCGCFGDLSSGPVGWGSVARNIVMVAIALWVVVKGGGGIAVERLWSRDVGPDKA